MFDKWTVAKVTGKIAGTVNIGVLSVTGEMGLEAAQTYDVIQSAKTGVSPCNIPTDLAMLEGVVGKFTSLGKQAASNIRKAVEMIDIHASMLGIREMQILEIPLKSLQLAEFPDAVVMIISVLLSVGKVLGRESAVQVTRSFIEKVVAAEKGPDPDRVRLDSILLSLIGDVDAGGPNWVRFQADKYDIAATEGEGIAGSVRFKEVTFGMMVSLVWWLYQGMKADEEGQAASQKCKTYDCRLHKVAYLLEHFGWPVHAALKDEGERFAGARRILVQAHECGEGVEDLPLLKPKEVEMHGLEVPQSGIGMVCKYNDIGKVLRARIGSANNLGLNMESGWEEGWKIGISREVTFRATPGFSALVFLGDPTIEAGDSENLGCDKLLRFIQVTGNIKNYSGRFHRMYNGTRKEYEGIDVSAMLKKTFVPKTPLEAALVGFALGYICGSVFSVATEMKLFQDKDDVYLSWISDMSQFLYNINGPIQTGYFPGTNPGLGVGGCLNVIAACFYGEADRFSMGKRLQVSESCIGTWAGDKLLLLEALVNPTLSLRTNCQVQELSFLPINIPCAGKFIHSAQRNFNAAHTHGVAAWAKPQESVLAKPPTNKVSVSIGPNLIDNDGSVMHTMYASKKMIHCASILDALTTRKGEENRSRRCQHQGPDTQVYKPSGDLLAYPVSDTDLIEHGVLIPPSKPKGGGQDGSARVGTIVVQVYGDDLWRYTAASMYSRYNPSIASDCLACAQTEQAQVIIL